MSEPHQREEVIFEAALKLPADQRAAFLQSACGNDEGLRSRVTGLLKAHEEAGGFLAQPASPGRSKTIVLSLTPDEKPGDRIGRYKLLQQIGEGGCGVVYMGEQEEPVRRRVALKVIKLGMDTKSVIARFEAERQALAMMDHPNIAKVLDAGATEIGRPFFVMELVRGIKITEYCDQNKLSTPERLKLFMQVCNAIQHAHQKGIIHRDIKPSNILVTLHDGVPVPKVIDFGIAKATQGRLTDQTLFTAFEQFIGTPAYMSPEQAEMSGLDIDTRSDIYALGVLLYELLTGLTPFDAKELLQAGLDELRRTIREKEPARPSTRLSTMVAADLTAVAQRRHAEAPKLIHSLRGDLDWIVMKSLEKDRTRRYETANGLAMDVQRYLNNEPIVARPPSTIYRFQKLVRRNKTVFLAGSAGMAALVMGLILALYLYAQEKSALKRAIAAEAVQKQMREQAEQSAEWSKEISRAELFMMHDQFEEAERALEKVPPHASLVAIYNVFGMIHARRSQWAPAVTNYAMVAQFAPTEFASFDALAVLTTRTGDEAGYHHWRQEIIERFGAIQDSENATTLAEDCLVLPPSPSDWDGVSKLVAKSLTSTLRRDVAYSQLVKGLYEYRQGHFAEAKDWLQKVTADSDAINNWNRSVEATMILAMAQYRLEELDAARATLAGGLEIARKKMIKTGDDLHDEWQAWLLAQLFMREAAAMMPDVAASNSAFAGLVTAPSWQTALSQEGMKFTTDRQDDGTWEVDIDDQPLTDLSPLHGAPLSRLSVMHTAVADLTPLRGMRLKWLRLAGAKVSDLSPLQGMPLESLQISGTMVADLAPLQGMPLRVLNMTACAGITNLEPIAEIKTFQSVILPPNAKDFEFLRGLTNLTRLSFKYDSTIKGPAQSAAEFWAEHDKTKLVKATP